jgi:radical SAM superfamily enzyme YgiQ (UPF0313 family)
MFTKPLTHLVKELKSVAGRGARYVWFVDDNFRLGRKDLNRVCERFVDEGLGLRWMTMLRADTLHQADVDLLRRAGCIEVQLGLESADPQILRNMNKMASPKIYKEAVERALEAGINCSCYFIFGFPGETDETARRTLAFIKELEHPELPGALSWSLFPFSLYPMSPVYEVEERRRYGLSGYLREWSHKTMNSGQAMAHVRAGFLELDRSSPVYRGDNLDMLLSLSPPARKNFAIERHRLSKRALNRDIRAPDVYETFGGLLGYPRRDKGVRDTS